MRKRGRADLRLRLPPARIGLPANAGRAGGRGGGAASGIGLRAGTIRGRR